MIPYIGDISKADADVLQYYASKSKNILEFGCGASTQVITKYKDEASNFVSVDTSPEWIFKTQRNLDRFDIRWPVFFGYDEFIPSEEKYDFVFDDGVDSLRRSFGIAIWPHIKGEGVLALHDTRRAPDFRNAIEIIAHFQDEVKEVKFNARGSNITLIYKRNTPLPYENWQITEKKEGWQLGYGNPPEEFIKSLKNDS